MRLVSGPVATFYPTDSVNFVYSSILSGTFNEAMDACGVVCTPKQMWWMLPLLVRAHHLNIDGSDVALEVGVQITRRSLYRFRECTSDEHCAAAVSRSLRPHVLRHAGKGKQPRRVEHHDASMFHPTVAVPCHLGHVSTAFMSASTPWKCLLVMARSQIVFLLVFFDSLSCAAALFYKKMTGCMMRLLRLRFSGSPR